MRAARKSATTLVAGDQIAIEPSPLRNPDEAWVVTRPSQVRKRSQVWTTVQSTRRVATPGRGGATYTRIRVSTDAGTLTVMPQEMCATPFEGETS
ncbi:MAG: hypothetical protein NVS3B1_06110 [Marmoricola sp.]